METSTNRTVIVGAGISGRLAKLIAGPESDLLEAAPEGKHRSTMFAGVHYLHEQIDTIKTHPIQVITGVCDTSYDDMVSIRQLPPFLEPIHAGYMERYRAKTKGMRINADTIASHRSAEQYLAGRQDRYAFHAYRYAFDEPQVDVLHGRFVEGIDVKARIVYAVVTEEDGCPRQEVYPYDKLVWTAPLNALATAVGLDPASLELESRPIYYCSYNAHESEWPRSNVSYGQELEADILVEYIIDEDTPVYRRSVQRCQQTPERLIVTLESMEPVGNNSSNEWRRIFPGKITRSPLADAFVKIMAGNGIYCAGRFATWNPDELIHHTEASLKQYLA